MSPKTTTQSLSPLIREGRLFLDDWRDSRDWCVRCGAELLDVADEETHYFCGLCAYCACQWRRLSGRPRGGV